MTQLSDTTIELLERVDELSSLTGMQEELLLRVHNAAAERRARVRGPADVAALYLEPAVAAAVDRDARQVHILCPFCSASCRRRA